MGDTPWPAGAPGRTFSELGDPGAVSLSFQLLLPSPKPWSLVKEGSSGSWGESWVWGQL